MSPEPPVPRWIERLSDILDAVSEIQRFVEGLDFDHFKGDPKTLKAIEADFIIIGEAVGHIPEDVQSSNPGIPWQQMRAMRNRIVHAYFDVSPQVLWDTVQHDLPSIEGPIQQIIQQHQ